MTMLMEFNFAQDSLPEDNNDWIIDMLQEDEADYCQDQFDEQRLYWGWIEE